MLTLPDNILENVKKPQFRGSLTTEDSSQSGFGLISAGNEEGKVYCLINPETKIVEKATFLAYGKLQSVVVLDLFCELIKNAHIDAACSLDKRYMESKAKEKFDNEAIQSEDFFFLTDICEKMKIAHPNMVVTPPPAEKDKVYKRKDKKDMDEHDLKWLPLPAPEKISQVELSISTTLKTKTQLSPKAVTLYNVKKDLEVIVKFSDEVESAQKPLITSFIAENLHGDCHPQIQVVEKEA